MKPIKKLTDRLIELAEGVPWETFEKVTDGNLCLVDHESLIICEDDSDFCPPRYDYHLRVGLYLNRPMQVIISCYNFIRMRPGDKWYDLQLGQLDPRRPADSMLYSMSRYSITQDRILLSPSIWDPSLAAWNAARRAHQMAQQPYQPNSGMQQAASHLFNPYVDIYNT